MLSRVKHIFKQCTGKQDLLFTSAYNTAACKDILLQLCADKKNPYSWSSKDGQYFEIEAELSFFYTTNNVHQPSRITGKLYEKEERCYIEVSVMASPALYQAILVMLFGFWAAYHNLVKRSNWNAIGVFLVLGLLVPAGIFWLNYRNRKSILKELNRVFMVSPAPRATY